MSEEDLQELVTLGVLPAILRCDPKKIDVVKLLAALFPSEPVYPTLFVRAPARTLEEAIKEGHHHFVSPAINSANFSAQPAEFEGNVDIDPFKNKSSSIEKINSLTILGRRPLNSLELLNYAIAYKNMQRRYKIVALGDFWLDDDGTKWVVVIYSEDGERIVSLVSFDGNNWDDSYFCASVSK